MLHGWLTQYVALTHHAAADLLRQPVVLMVALASLTLTALLPSLVIFQFGEPGKLVRDGALALHLVAGLILAAHGASVTLHREIRRGTAAVVLAKPVSRATFFLAKYAAIVFMLAVFTALSTGVALIGVRAGLAVYATDWWAEITLWSALLVGVAGAALDHYRTGRAFPARAFTWLACTLGAALLVTAWVGPGGRVAPWGRGLSGALLPVLALNLLALWVLAAVALALATRLPPLFTHATCAVLLFVGLIADYVVAIWPSPVLRAMLALVPNWQDFWRADALNNGGAVPWSYVAWSAVYAGLYLTGCLGLGFMLFKRTEIR